MWRRKQFLKGGGSSWGKIIRRAIDKLSLLTCLERWGGWSPPFLRHCACMHTISMQIATIRNAITLVQCHSKLINDAFKTKCNYVYTHTYMYLYKYMYKYMCTHPLYLELLLLRAGHGERVFIRALRELLGELHDGVCCSVTLEHLLCDSCLTATAADKELHQLQHGQLCVSLVAVDPFTGHTLRAWGSELLKALTTLKILHTEDITCIIIKRAGIANTCTCTKYSPPSRVHVLHCKYSPPSQHSFLRIWH